MEEERSKVPGIDDVTWLLEQAEAARASGDLRGRLQRLAEARHAIELMQLDALLEATAGSPKVADPISSPAASSAAILSRIGERRRAEVLCF